MPSTGGLDNAYANRAEYEAAMAEWQRKKAAGDPFPGPMPRLTAEASIDDTIARSGFQNKIQDQDMLAALTQQGANAPANANPYSTIVANQARPAQEALYAQMVAQRAGPSLAGMQGARAMGQNLTAALGSGDGRALLNRAGGVGAGLASDTATGTLAEQLRASAGIGSMASGVRAADLGVAQQQAQTGIDQRGLDDAMRQFYATQGAGFDQAAGRNALEAFKLRKRAESQQKKDNLAAVDTGVGAVAGAFGGFLG